MAEAKYAVLTRRPSRRKCLIISLIGVILLIVIVLVIIFVIKKGDDKKPTPSPKKDEVKASKYKNAAVATDATVCSQVGADILKKNGSAVDAAIAASFCVGVANPQSCGIGGGGFMVIYQRKNKKFVTYDFRETAPAASTRNMFSNKSSVYGGLAVGVPGQVKGMWEVHKKYGNLPWSDVVEPSIKLAEDGFVVTKPVANTISSKMKKILSNPHVPQELRQLFMKTDGSYLQEGDLFKNTALATTLRAIQLNATGFYEGELAKKVVNDVRNASGILTLDDLKNYTVKVREVMKLQLPNDLRLNTMSAPGGGPVVAMIHNIMMGYDLSKMDLSKLDDEVAYYHRLIESMKFSFAQRGLIGDPDFLPKDEITKVLDLMKDPDTGKKIRENRISLNKTHNTSYYGGYWGKNDFGTSHTSVLAENGDAVSVTNTINYGFGSLVYSPVTGIIYNNEMDDFSTPNKSNLYGYAPTPANFILPGKRPLSSMSPSIVTDKNGDVKMVIGASGGSRIITGVAQVLLKELFFEEELGKAVNDFRLHHQGIPNNIITFNEKPPPHELVQRLKKLGHAVVSTGGWSAVQAIYKNGTDIYAMSDPRKHAKAAGY